jgi:NAD(P)-dependent dehydrogenase (short-subunit alcohol dehydrogenase family)
MQEGANVALADLAGSEGGARVAELDAKCAGRCLFLAVDLIPTAKVEQMVAATVKALGSLDGVFNTAGIGGLSPADTCPDEEFLRIVDNNLTSVFRVARPSLRQRYSQGRGSLVNCASILGVVGQSMTAAYSAAKGGVVNLTRALALEAAAKGARVNAVVPGYVDTPLLAVLDDTTREMPIQMHPIGRLGRSEEVANAVLLLLSDESGFVTGSNLVVDGGFTAGKS